MQAVLASHDAPNDLIGVMGTPGTELQLRVYARGMDSASAGAGGRRRTCAVHARVADCCNCRDKRREQGEVSRDR